MEVSRKCDNTFGTGFNSRRWVVCSSKWKTKEVLWVECWAVKEQMGNPKANVENFGRVLVNVWPMIFQVGRMSDKVVHDFGKNIDNRLPDWLSTVVLGSSSGDFDKRL